MAFILDNSVASGWFLENRASPYTEAIAARLNDETAHAPALWELELSAAFQALAHHTPEHGAAIDAFLASMKK